MAVADPSMIRAITRAATDQGWVVRRTRKSHIQFVPPDKRRELIICATTSNHHKMFPVLIARLRRGGLIWPVP